MAVDFYPEDAAFEAISNVVRKSLRTFELFELAQTFLAKEERMVIVVDRLRESDPPFVIAEADGLPFETEEEAIEHIFAEQVERYFEVEEVEVDPPKGTFNQVVKCGFTGDVIGPPNYHRYQAMLREHHAKKIHNMSFERFQERLETVRDEEAVAAWLESMKTQPRYTAKEFEGDEAPQFPNLESARIWLLSQRRSELLRTERQARFLGARLAKLPHGNIRRSVEGVLERQRHFPLDTANNLRGRFRRNGFTVYKRGSKGISFVSAVRRQFRQPDQTFTDSIQMLIEFIENHPDVPVGRLPEDYLGIDATPPPEAKRPVSPDPATTEDPKPQIGVPAAEKAPPPDEPVEGAEPGADSAAAPEADAAGSDEPTPDAAAKGESTTSEPEPSGKKVPTPTAPDPEALTELRRDLHWLIAEGYVIQYSNGNLYAPPPQNAPPPEPKGKPENSEKAESTGKSERPRQSEKSESADRSPRPQQSEVADTEEVERTTEGSESR